MFLCQLLVSLTFLFLYISKYSYIIVNNLPCIILDFFVLHFYIYWLISQSKHTLKNVKFKRYGPNFIHCPIVICEYLFMAI